MEQNHELPKVYNPQDFEDRIYAMWSEKGYFTPDPKDNRPPFCIVIPPPNVTGQLHMGHALDETLQDILIRAKRMQGYNTLWVPGTDHAGIATQIKVEEYLRKNEGITRYDLGREKFLERVWAWKEQYGGRIVEQLKKLGGMEFYDVNFSYIDLEDMSEHYVSVPEQGGGKLIPDGMCNPGQVYTVSRGKSGMIGVFRLESQMLPGNGKIERTGLGSDSKCKEAVNTAFNYLKANGNRISGSISTSTKDYIINYQDLQGIGMTDKLALPTLIALCSIALGKPVVSNLAVLGDITISGTMIKVDELANTLQVCLDSGAKKVLIPSTSFVDFASVPADLMSAFQLIPYQSAEDAVFKALGVE